MGLYLAAAKIHKVEYGKIRALNYQIESVERLLMDLGQTLWVSEDSKRMQIDREDLLNVASTIASLSDEEFAKYRFDKEFDKKYVSSSLRDLANESDKSDSIVYLYWF